MKWFTNALQNILIEKLGLANLPDEDKQSIKIGLGLDELAKDLYNFSNSIKNLYTHTNVAITILDYFERAIDLVQNNDTKNRETTLEKITIEDKGTIINLFIASMLLAFKYELENFHNKDLLDSLSHYKNFRSVILYKNSNINLSEIDIIVPKDIKMHESIRNLERKFMNMFAYNVSPRQKDQVIAFLIKYVNKKDMPELQKKLFINATSGNEKINNELISSILDKTDQFINKINEKQKDEINTEFFEVLLDVDSDLLIYVKSIFPEINFDSSNLKSKKPEDVVPSQNIALIEQAFMSNDLETVMKLISDPTFNPNQTDSKNMTPLQYALKHKHFNIAKQLITFQNINLNLKDPEENRTPLEYVLAYGTEEHLDIATCLINHPNVDINNSFINTDHSPFIYAALCGYTKIVMLLAEKKVDLNQKDSMGMTALMYAARGGYIDIVKFLMPTVNIHAGDDDGMTALDYAKFKNHSKVVALIEDAIVQETLNNKIGVAETPKAASPYQQSFTTFSPATPSQRYDRKAPEFINNTPRG